ncbi:MAG: citrate lyase acyl carrier protein [Clostridia bacterium]|nr:citrate lyase acyl carrier protein [Clostridia bacterium]
MKIKKSAMVGTLESSDIQISITQNDSEENVILLESPVKHLFGEEIERVIDSVLTQYQMQGVVVKAIDKGALNCTIAARMQAVIYRAIESEIDWELR